MKLNDPKLAAYAASAEEAIKDYSALQNRLLKPEHAGLLTDRVVEITAASITLGEAMKHFTAGNLNDWELSSGLVNIVSTIYLLGYQDATAAAAALQAAQLIVERGN